MDIDTAIREGNLPLVREFLDQNTYSNAYLSALLIYTAQYNHLPIVQELLNRGANIHAKDDWVLIIAAANGMASIVRELLNRGADVHAQNDQALIEASRYGYSFVVQELLEDGANIGVLSPRSQARYQHLVSEIIDSERFYLLESLIEEIRDDLSDRYILRTKYKVYIIRKDRS